MVDDERLAASCDRFVQGHGRRPPAVQLDQIPREVVGDRYGAGGVVAELEREVASLLGMEAALFLPSGTMAQQIALRVHADHRASRGVAFHPTCHLFHREELALEALHRLGSVPVGAARRVIEIADLESLGSQDVGSLLLELPQREIGGQLPSFPELEQQASLAKERGWALHLDGARLWEAAAGYERSPAEVARLFDSVYVSFYKGLGGIAGCCLAGPADFIEEASRWRTRHGGRVVALWPYAASDLSSLRRRLPRMARYHQHARAAATELSHVDGVQVTPNPPQVSMMHLTLNVDAETLGARCRRLAREQGIWSWPAPFPSCLETDDERSLVEFTVGDATLELSAQEIAEVVDFLTHG